MHYYFVQIKLIISFYNTPFYFRTGFVPSKTYFKIQIQKHTGTKKSIANSVQSLHGPVIEYSLNSLPYFCVGYYLITTS